MILDKSKNKIYLNILFQLVLLEFIDPHIPLSPVNGTIKVFFTVYVICFFYK